MLIAPTGVTLVRTGEPAVLYTWCEIREITWIWGYYLLLGGPGVALAIPVRAFTDAAEGEEFLRRAREWQVPRS